MPRVLVRIAAVLGCLGAATAGARELPGTVLTLEASGDTRPDRVTAAAPYRFALLEDGQVFVGGTSGLLVGRIAKDEVEALERRLAEIRKLPGLASVVAFSAAPTGYRLVARKGKPLDVLAQGDPGQAHPALAPLAALVRDLSGFSHVSLRRYEPAQYALLVREGKLEGGCRTWTLPVSMAEALAGPRVVRDDAAAGWPTGATPAQVCAEGKTYLAALRPLVPGEKP